MPTAQEMYWEAQRKLDEAIAATNEMAAENEDLRRQVAEMQQLILAYQHQVSAGRD